MEEEQAVVNPNERKTKKRVVERRSPQDPSHQDPSVDLVQAIDPTTLSEDDASQPPQPPSPTTHFLPRLQITTTTAIATTSISPETPIRTHNILPSSTPIPAPPPLFSYTLPTSVTAAALIIVVLVFAYTRRRKVPVIKEDAVAELKKARPVSLVSVASSVVSVGGWVVGRLTGGKVEERIQEIKVEEGKSEGEEELSGEDDTESAYMHQWADYNTVLYGHAWSEFHPVPQSNIALTRPITPQQPHHNSSQPQPFQLQISPHHHQHPSFPPFDARIPGCGQTLNHPPMFSFSVHRRCSVCSQMRRYEGQVVVGDNLKITLHCCFFVCFRSRYQFSFMHSHPHPFFLYL
ncbi:hypothetical protein BC829DRAFT_489488 [Chytridium lagenaria]|nr:hypothetical protein BC829DRAFT_489488 [Chytridium lagenaria]